MNTNVKIFLSDEAYNSLKDMATTSGYIRVKDRALGIGRFIDILSTLQYVDNRPSYLKEWKPTSLNIWCIPEYAGSSKMRSINISHTSIYNFIKLSLQFDILRITLQSNPTSESYKIQFKSNQTHMMIVSAVLEAIGTDLLIPITPILPPKYTQKPRIRIKEFSW